MVSVFLLYLTVKRATGLLVFLYYFVLPSLNKIKPLLHDFRVISALTWARASAKRRDFPQTNMDSAINSPLLLNEHGLMKDIFEEEKKFDSGT